MCSFQGLLRGIRLRLARTGLSRGRRAWLPGTDLGELRKLPQEPDFDAFGRRFQYTATTRRDLEIPTTWRQEQSRLLKVALSPGDVVCKSRDSPTWAEVPHGRPA